MTTTTMTLHHSIPLALDLAAAWRSRDEEQIVGALKPILDDRRTTTDVLLTLVAIQGVEA